MACRLSGARPLSEQILDYCWLELWEQTSVNPNRNSYIFIQLNAFENAVWKWQLFCRGLNVLTESKTWINNHTHSFVWDVITYPQSQSGNYLPVKMIISHATSAYMYTIQSHKSCTFQGNDFFISNDLSSEHLLVMWPIWDIVNQSYMHRNDLPIDELNSMHKSYLNHVANDYHTLFSSQSFNWFQHPHILQYIIYVSVHIYADIYINKNFACVRVCHFVCVGAHVYVRAYIVFNFHMLSVYMILSYSFKPFTFIVVEKSLIFLWCTLQRYPCHNKIR